MGKFRKLPVEIEAANWNGDAFGEPIAPWLFAALDKPQDQPGSICRDDDDLHITTLEGIMTARKGDWIIRGVNGEIYPCKPDIFNKTYEAVPSDPA